MEITKLSQNTDRNLKQTQTNIVKNSKEPDLQNLNQGPSSNGSKKEDKQLDSLDLQDLTSKLNEQMKSLDTNIRFSYNEGLKGLTVEVTEKSTGRVIRQIPSEEAIKMAEHFRNVIGLIFDKES